MMRMDPIAMTGSGVCFLIVAFVVVRLLRQRSRGVPVRVALVDNKTNLGGDGVSWSPVFRIEDGDYAGTVVTSSNRMSRPHRSGSGITATYDPADNTIRTRQTTRSDLLTALAFALVGVILFVGAAMIGR